MVENSSQEQTVDTRQYRHSIRLQFQFDGESLRLISQTRIRKIAPASPVPRPKVGQQRGFWVEIQTADKRTVFHRILHNPLRTHVEVHSPDRKPRIVTGPPMPGIFEVLVPDIPNAVTVAVFGMPLDAERARGAKECSEELGRFDLSTRNKEGSS